LFEAEPTIRKGRRRVYQDRVELSVLMERAEREEVVAYAQSKRMNASQLARFAVLKYVRSLGRG
jgi:hypothetical protein